MAMDTKAIREMLVARHEVEADGRIRDPNISSLPAIQTALLCDIADHLAALRADKSPFRDGTFHIDFRSIGVPEELIVEGVRRGVEMAMREAQRRAVKPERYDFSREYASPHEGQSAQGAFDSLMRRRGLGDIG